jgi:hypothetical protein
MFLLKIAIKKRTGIQVPRPKKSAMGFQMLPTPNETQRFNIRSKYKSRTWLDAQSF